MTAEWRILNRLRRLRVAYSLRFCFLRVVVAFFVRSPRPGLFYRGGADGGELGIAAPVG
jgi:hypothetical protein